MTMTGLILDRVLIRVPLDKNNKIKVSLLKKEEQHTFVGGKVVQPDTHLMLGLSARAVFCSLFALA